MRVAWRILVASWPPDEHGRVLKVRRSRALAAVAAAAIACVEGPTYSEPPAGNPHRWHVEGDVTTAPAVDDSSVFAAVGPHILVSVSKETGTERWRSATGETYPSPGGRNVLVIGAVVVYADYGLYAFDRRTG